MNDLRWLVASPRRREGDRAEKIVDAAAKARDVLTVDRVARSSETRWTAWPSGFGRHPRTRRNLSGVTT
jgi:hypothetical protein